MTAEEIQNVIVSLNNSIEQFSARLEAVVLGIPKNKDATTDAPSIINGEAQTESLKNTNERNGGIGPSDIKFIDELHKKFKPLFDELTVKSSSNPKTEDSDVADVLKGDETEKITKVSIVNISDEALKSLSKAINGGENAATKGGGGFLSGIMGLLGGVGATAIGGGLIALLTSLPAALPGIAVALGAIVAGAAAFSAAAVIVIKTISYLKEDIVGIFPIIKDFAKLFTEIALAAIPVVGKALSDLATTVLPVLFKALREFTSEILPILIKGALDLINSPGFNFLVKQVVPALKETFKFLGTVLTEIIVGIKSIFTDIKDVLISLFQNIKAIVVPVMDDIKKIIIAIAEPVERTLTGLFKNVKQIIISISNNIKETVLSIGGLIKSTILGVLDKIDSVFTKVPTIIGNILNKIKDFANEIQIGKIGAVAGEVSSLAGALFKLTAGDLLGNIGKFFSKSPFDKIIEFQNNIDAEKLAVISTLAPNLERLVNINADQLKGLSSLIDELLNKSIEVSATVEKLFSGEKGWFSKSGGILEIVDKLESAKQGAESTIASIIVKKSDAQRRVSELQLNETKMTNKILGEIFKKMNAMSINAAPNAPASTPNANVIDARLPLQFTSTGTRQQMVQSGAVN
jgi:hypothetical protein